jgi:hypothetical protein
MERLRCLRCKVSWMPRIEGQPKQCPSCHSPYWNVERTRGVLAKPAQVSSVQTLKHLAVEPMKAIAPPIKAESAARSSGCLKCGAIGGVHMKGCK